MATYEDAGEAKFLENIFTGRSGQLENTVFVMLAPDGKKPLSQAGRGPQMAFRSPQLMTREMKKLAKRYPPQDVSGAPLLPQMKNFRLGLNVAECDARPLVVCLATDEAEMKAMQDKLSPLSFSDELCGRFNYASVNDPEELKTITGDKPANGFLVISPGEFGTAGAIQFTLAAAAPAAEISKQLNAFADQFQRRDKEHRKHVRKGQQNNVDWQTEIPVTDPMSNAAKERASGQSKGKRGGRRGKGKRRDR